MSDPTATAACTTREFKPGWLAPILQDVVDEIEARDPEDRPRLTAMANDQ